MKVIRATIPPVQIITAGEFLGYAMVLLWSAVVGKVIWIALT